MAAVRGPGQAPREGQSCFDEEDFNCQSRPENGWGEAYQYSRGLRQAGMLCIAVLF